MTGRSLARRRGRRRRRRRRVVSPSLSSRSRSCVRLSRPSASGRLKVASARRPSVRPSVRWKSVRPSYARSLSLSRPRSIQPALTIFPLLETNAEATDDGGGRSGAAPRRRSFVRSATADRKEREQRGWWSVGRSVGGTHHRPPLHTAPLEPASFLPPPRSNGDATAPLAVRPIWSGISRSSCSRRWCVAAGRS